MYPSKEDKVLELFFNESFKNWHFKDVVKKAELSEQRANFWLKKFTKEKIIKHVKPKGKMPYFIGNFGNPVFDNKKKLYGLNKLFKSGLLNKLKSLKAKTVVIFGSFGRGEWHSESDVDVFVYGDPENLEFGSILGGREIQVHSFRTKKDIKDIRSG